MAALAWTQEDEEDFLDDLQMRARAEEINAINRRISNRGRQMMRASAVAAASGLLWQLASGAAGRYLNEETNTYLPQATVAEEVENYLRFTYPDVSSLSAGLRDGSLDLDQWYEGMRHEIIRAQLVAVAFERGGWDALTPEDYDFVAAEVREQLAYLHNFTAQIAEGSQPLDGSLDARARLYIDRSRNAYYKSRRRSLDPSIEFVRSLRHWSDSCEECIELDGVAFTLDGTEADDLDQEILGDLPITPEEAERRRRRQERRRARRAAAAKASQPEETAGPPPEHDVPFDIETFRKHQDEVAARRQVRTVVNNDTGEVIEIDNALDMFNPYLGYLEEAVEEGQLAIRVPANALIDILDTGRFKSQFETKTSGGTLNPAVRKKGESQGFGYPSDLPLDQRPIYGYLENPWVQGPGQYGQVVVILKDEMRSRTTMTYGDSLSKLLDETAAAAFIDEPHLSMFGNISYGLPEYEAAENGEDALKLVPYLELQFHGGVGIDMIKEVIVRDTKDVNLYAFENMLRDAGIPWRIEQDPAPPSYW